MPTIKGPIKFSKDEIPQQMKDWVRINGIKFPIEAEGLNLINKPDWVKIRKE